MGFIARKIAVLIWRRSSFSFGLITPLGRKAPAFEAGDIRLFLFLRDCLKPSLSKRPIAGHGEN